MKLAEWAAFAARRIIENHGDAAAIDTADYLECSFIIAAAELALTDESIARKISQRMEPPRELDGNGGQPRPRPNG